jgi:hypothetical protein
MCNGNAHLYMLKAQWNTTINNYGLKQLQAIRIHFSCSTISFQNEQMFLNRSWHLNPQNNLFYESILKHNIVTYRSIADRLYGLVVRVPGYRSLGPGFDPLRYQIFPEVVGLERGPLSLVKIIVELFEWNNSVSSLETRN